MPCLCKHCTQTYTPCPYNRKRQKYCTRKNCKKERNVIRSTKWREENPDYFKDSTERTAVYRQQKRERQAFVTAAKAEVHEVNREFVALTKTSAKLLERSILTLVGAVIFFAGDPLQTSAHEMGNILEKCYDYGVGQTESDPVLKTYLENFHEEINRSDQKPPT